MADNPGGHYKPEKRGLVISLVRALNENRTATKAPKPPKDKK